MPPKQASDSDLREQLAMMMMRLDAMKLEINALWSQSTTSPGPPRVESLQLVKEPTELKEPEEPAEPAEPAEPKKPAEPAEPVESEKSVESVESTQLKDPHEQTPLLTLLNTSNSRTP